MSNPAPAPQTQNPPAQPQQIDPNNEIVQGQMNRDAIVNELVGMGFGEEQSRQALMAAFYNKERAIDYLINGIPNHILQGLASKILNYFFINFREKIKIFWI